MLTNEAIKEIEKVLGYTFSSKALLSQAFSRSSFAEEDRMHGGKGLSNEQLEFYGDSVLNYVVVDALSIEHTVIDKEGNVHSRTQEELTNFVSFWTDKNMLSFRMEKLGLNKYLLLGKGDIKQDVGNNKSAKEDLFEAIIGAIWFDSNRNLRTVSNIVYKLLDICFEDWCFDKNESEKFLEYVKKYNEEVAPFIKNGTVEEDGTFVCEIEEDGKKVLVRFKNGENCQISNMNSSTNVTVNQEILELKKRIDTSTVTEENAIQKLIQLFQLKIIKNRPQQEENYDFENSVWRAKVTLADASIFVAVNHYRNIAKNQAALQAFKYAYEKAGSTTQDGKLIEL